MTEPIRRKKVYLDGDEYYDSPLDEHYCKHKRNEDVRFTNENYVYPCYVYDKNGKLLRVEYPKSKEIKGLKWLGRY